MRSSRAMERSRTRVPISYLHFPSWCWCAGNITNENQVDRCTSCFHHTCSGAARFVRDLVGFLGNGRRRGHALDSSGRIHVRSSFQENVVRRIVPVAGVTPESVRLPEGSLSVRGSFERLVKSPEAIAMLEIADDGSPFLALSSCGDGLCGLPERLPTRVQWPDALALAGTTRAGGDIKSVLAWLAARPKHASRSSRMMTVRLAPGLLEWVLDALPVPLLLLERRPRVWFAYRACVALY